MIFFNAVQTIDNLTYDNHVQFQWYIRNKINAKNKTVRKKSENPDWYKNTLWIGLKYLAN